MTRLGRDEGGVERDPPAVGDADEGGALEPDVVEQAE